MGFSMGLGVGDQGVGGLTVHLEGGGRGGLGRDFLSRNRR